MKPLSRIRNILKKNVSPLQDEMLWHSVSSPTWEHFKRNDYENAYPSLSKRAQGFAAIEPYHDGC
jgi:hypothetical protein